jgi:Protein of unknown function (DUF3306)
MSAPENFFSRWSRRKRADSQPAQQSAATVATDEPASGAATVPQQPVANANDGALPLPELPFDISKLPPIESITAGTDIRGFLAPGVPAELARAALRRAWTADPAIRDFVGLAENSWDFNSPDGIAGFGPLEMTEELRRRIAEMVGRSLVTQAPENSSTTQVDPAALPATETSIQSVAESSSEPTQEDHSKAEIAAATAAEAQLIGATSNKGSDQNPTHVATQHRTNSAVEERDAPAKRLHGRALPK